MQHRIPMLLRQMADRAVQPHVLQTFTPQGIACTLWAYSKLAYLQNSLFDNLIDKASTIGIRKFSLSNLAMMSWALAEVYWHPVKEITDAMSERAIQLLRDEPELVLQSSTPQNVALIVGAFARLDVRDEYLLRVVAVYTCESGLVDRFMSREISLIAWAYAVQGVNYPKFTEALGKRAVQPQVMREFYRKTLLRAIGAFALLELDPEVLLQLRFKEFLLENKKTVPGTASTADAPLDPNTLQQHEVQVWGSD
jgi:hypothetical protein